MNGNFTEINHIKKRRFLNAFAELGGVRRAEAKTGVSRQSHYHWMQDDPEYATAFREAERMAGDVLEDEAVRRGHDGVEKPIFYKGRKIETVQEYSDTLLIFLLKGAKPEKYKDSRLDITSGGKELRLSIGGDSNLPDGI